MHGHNLRVRVEVEGDIDAKTGMVVDFGVLSMDLAEIVEPWDHKFLAPKDSARLGWWYGAQWLEKEAACSTVLPSRAYLIDWGYVLPAEDVVLLNLSVISSENLAHWILWQLITKPWAMGKLVRVQVSENGENIAEASHFVQKYSSTSSWTYTGQGQNWYVGLNANNAAAPAGNWVPTWIYPP
jgi:6-pyruvoyl-tetrahydropterin synthase